MTTGGRLSLRTLLSLLILVSSLALGVQAMAQDAEFVPGEVIVKLKGKAFSSQASGFLGKAKTSNGLSLKASFHKMNMHHFKLNANTDVKAKIKELQQDPDVEYAEPNYIYRKTVDADAGQIVKMSDQEMQDFVALGTGTAYQQSGAPVKATEAWNYSNNGSERPIVAIIDTGVDTTHSVFQDSQAIWQNANEIPGNHIDDDNNGYVDDITGWNFYTNSGQMYDDDGHGTHVAGIVLGVSQDIFDSQIAVSKIRIMPLKFLGSDGSGSTSSAIKAIYYAVNNGAQVINNSWGGPNYSSALHEALTYAYENGVVLVSAAGNSGKNNDSSTMYPANYDVPSNISVAASNDWDMLASFSNFGVSTVHISAPGVSIVSTTPNETFAYSSGTSMAAPFVAGLAAFIWRESPNLTGYQIKSAILDTSEYKSGLQGKVITNGRANVLDALQSTLSLSGADPFQPMYTAALKNERAPASDGAAIAGGGCGIVKSLTRGGGGPGQGTGLGFVVGILFLVPVMLYQAFRRKSGVQRRRHERFKLNSSLTVKVGDRELVGNLESISMGGVSFNADALLEKGGIITMQIKSPDGKEAVEVEGRVVWNEKNQMYGVQFADARETALQMISRWTSGLVKI